VLEIVLELAGREQIIAAKALFDARNALADMLAQIDSWMNGAGRPRWSRCRGKFPDRHLKFPVLSQKFPDPMRREFGHNLPKPLD
jgi:hypothetical protein